MCKPAKTMCYSPPPCSAVAVHSLSYTERAGITLLVQYMLECGVPQEEGKTGPQNTFCSYSACMAPFSPLPYLYCRTITSFLSQSPSVLDGLTRCYPCLSLLTAVCVMLWNECVLFWWGKDFPSGEGIIFAHGSGRLLLLWPFLLPHSFWSVSLLRLKGQLPVSDLWVRKTQHLELLGHFLFPSSV